MIALTALMPAVALMSATPSFAAGVPCDSTLSPSEIKAVGISCRLAPATVVRVAEDLEVAVPEPGTVATVQLLRTHGSASPSAASVYRAADGQLALRIDGEAALGSTATAGALNRILAKPEPAGATKTQASLLAAAPAWCGSYTQYAFSGGVWVNSTYPWTYNSKSQPASDALQAIQYGFKFITDDSSACGTDWTAATSDYRGSTTRYTWGTRDNGNVVGWAGFDPGILGATYSWVDGSGFRVEVDIAFNNRVTNWFTGLSGTVPSGRYDLISVATHEAGHGFGLAHYTSSSYPVMYPTLGTGVNKRVKRSGDLTGMGVLY
ncbi:matrixin family metalloprotease [Micromonospora coxensis]|uniref:matrixin family metalloprotease n=1 Tax=Micromonospora coxensis TaxID=356852 RepID=UPI0012FDE27E|nr:matrixin family metalloprotease [Micromonospora coxensis]